MFKRGRTLTAFNTHTNETQISKEMHDDIVLKCIVIRVICTVYAPVVRAVEEAADAVVIAIPDSGVPDIHEIF